MWRFLDVTNFTVITMNGNVISFICVIITLKWPSKGHSTENNRDCYFVTSHQNTFQWSHLVTIMSLLFGNSIAYMFYNECNSWQQIEVICWLVSKEHLWCLQCRVVKCLSPKSHHVIFVTLLQDDSIVTWPGDSPQGNKHSDFSVEPPNDDYLRVKIRWMKDITFWFTVLTMTLMTMWDIVVTAHQLTMMYG